MSPGLHGSGSARATVESARIKSAETIKFFISESSVITELTIETEELTGIEAEICDVNATAMKLRAHNPQAALDWLNQSEHLVESVSVSRQGRFFNQRALAWKDLGEYDRAILEFDRAAHCFEISGETELQGMVHNNVSRAYSLSGNYERARESSSIAIGLAVDLKYRIQWGDQLANILTDEGKLDEAEAECNRVLSLLVEGEQFDLLAECLSTKNRIEKQKYGACGKSEYMLHDSSRNGLPAHSVSPQQGDAMLSTPLECVQFMLQYDYQSALPLLTLIAKIADPNGDPDLYSGAWAAMQFLNVHTPRGESELQSHIDEIRNVPEEVSQISS